MLATERLVELDLDGRLGLGEVVVSICSMLWPWIASR